MIEKKSNSTLEGDMVEDDIVELPYHLPYAYISSVWYLSTFNHGSFTDPMDHTTELPWPVY